MKNLELTESVFEPYKGLSRANYEANKAPSDQPTEAIKQRDIVQILRISNAANLELKT